MSKKKMLVNPNSVAAAARHRILVARGQAYGPIPHDQQCVARVWQGLLEQHYQVPLPGPFPARMVGVFLVALKLSRMATPLRYTPDNLPDAHNYLDIADWCDPRSPQYRGKKGDQ